MTLRRMQSCPVVLLLLLVAGCSGNGVLPTYAPTPGGNPVSSVVTTTQAAPLPATATASLSAVSTTQDESDVQQTPDYVSDDGAYFVAPVYYSIEEDGFLNTEAAAPNHQWVFATVTLANEKGGSLTIAADDVALIGDDGERYSPQPMVERVSPALVGTTLAPTENVYGFALFALPVGVAPRLFEWCPTGICEREKLQAPIGLQE